MSFFSIFIKRPVSAVMFNMALVILGLACYFTMNVSNMPDVDLPIVTVFVQLPGGNPEVIESEITKRVEDSVASISGIDELSSTTTNGSATIMAQFIMEKDVDVAVQEVHDKINLVENNFPAGTLSPIVQKVSPSDTPIMVLTVTGDRDIKEMTEICRQDVKTFLQSINGVGQINIMGGRFREIQIDLDMDRINQYGLSVNQIFSSVDAQNTEVPIGRITGRDTEHSIRSTGRLNSVEEFRNIVVAQQGASQIYLRDIANVYDGSKEQRTVSRLNGSNALSLQIIKVKGGNTIKVIEAIKEKMKDLQSIIPADMSVEIIKDQSITIEKSVHEIMEHLFIGGGLACLLTFLFMKSLRTTIIAGVAIPTSVIATFIVMKLSDFTLDNITLLALALVVGLVIDDAVVVLENIWRLIEEEGMSPYEASINGIQDIGFAVLATSISLMVIFLPIAFVGGLVGKFLKSYAITMTTSVFFSMVVSFTLTPMLCSKLMVPPKEKGKPDKLTLFLQDGYEFFLRIFLNPAGSLILVAACVCSLLWAAGLARTVKAEFISSQDADNYDIVIKLPSEWTLERSSETLRKVEEELIGLPHMKYVLTTIGTANPGDDFNESSDIHQASIYLRMVPYDERAYDVMHWVTDLFTFKWPKKVQEYTQFDSMREARLVMAKYPVLRSQVQLESDITSSASADFSIILLGEDLELLRSSMESVITRLSATPGVFDVDTDTVFSNPEIRIDFDRQAAMDHNVDMQSAARGLSMLIGGAKLSSTFIEGQWTYDIRMRLMEKDRSNPDAVRRLYVDSRDGKEVYLASIASITEALSPSQIKHFNRSRSITLSASLDGYSQAKVMSDCQNYIKELNLPPGYGIAYSGNTKYMRETAQSLAMALLLSIIFVYMVLASQFESYWDPMIIIATVPFTVPFALFALTSTGKSLNMYSGLGLFLLFGIVMKNAILQVEHANHVIHSSGLSVKESIIKANRERVRPILMTTLTIIAGMLPIAVAGADGNAKSPMAIVVVGGQSMCFFLTLLLVPVMQNYLHIFTDPSRKPEKQKKALPPGEPPVLSEDDGVSGDWASAEPAVSQDGEKAETAPAEPKGGPKPGKKGKANSQKESEHRDKKE